MATIKICDLCGERNAKTITLHSTDWVEDASDPDGGHFPYKLVDLCPEHMAEILNKVCKTHAVNEVQQALDRIQ